MAKVDGGDRDLIHRDLAPDTWDAYATLIEAHGGIFGGCWCLVFHAGTKGGSFAERRERKRAMVAAGKTHAALVFDGGTCVGWAQYGPPEELPEIRCKKAYEAELGAEPPDWRITCFFIDRRYRRQGVAAVALEGALAAIARRGGGRVEAYPEALEGQKTSAGFLWGGTLGLFERAGFEAERRIGKHRMVVAKEVGHEEARHTL